MSQPESSEKRADVAICVASCRRPEGLHALLGGLAAQVFPGDPPSLCVHVIDNDLAASARPVVEAAQSWFPHPIEYAAERRPGIPQTRNASLSSALGSAEWLAFIDDDEIPDPCWLTRLLETQRASGADVVTGPVVARFQAPPPEWVRRGAFFDPPRHPTGAEVVTAYTNNALVRADAVAALPWGFDERLRVGEDSEFFERLRARGSRIVWCDEALVHDSVPPERATWKWLVARGFGNGVARTRIDRWQAPRGAFGRSLQRGLRRLAGGALQVVWAPDKAARVRGLEVTAVGAGRLAGLLGVR
jgi:glycosyltransferase involved in cell wall biosynthesis